MAVRIITDSTCDIPQSKQKALGIDIVPLSVLFGSERFVDGVDLTNEEFYEKLSKSATLPTTSQVNPDGFFDLFKKYVESGDEIVGLFISSKLSGTYQSAVIAKDMIETDQIHLIDSSTTTFGLALLVYEAIKSRDAGMSAKEIYDRLMALRGRIKLYAVVDTLKYLKMGGRLSASAAAVGSILNIKPIVSLADGEVKAIGKARGKNAAFAHIADLIRKNPPDERFTKTAGNTNCPETMREFNAFIESAVGFKPDYICDMGCVIGTHAGPGAVGLAYIC